MVRKGVYLTYAQVKFLEEQNDLTIAEHIRRALDDYIDTLVSWKACASASKINKNQYGGHTNPSSDR